MWDLLDTAHPVLTLTMVMVLLAALWMIHVLQMRLRVAENRLESLEAELRTVDEELEVLVGGHAAAASPPATPGAELLAALGEAGPEAPAAPPA
ncbi:MAG: hypothetical protein H6704_27335 [Myxococcales bacterium]|nr:hypothetical protein [Myxococcales bacterium]